MRAALVTTEYLQPKTHGWDENSIKYDANGNIQALRRDSSVQGTLASGVLIDQLKYTYSTSIPDQLYTVYDTSGSAKGFIGGGTGSHYTYDANGNLTNEPYQGITHISYDVLNRTDTTVITAGSTYITYTYDAGGMLLRKKAYNGGTLTQTDYIGGFVYTGNGTTQTLAYAPMPEGRLLGTALTQEFVITDPQGNARVAFQNVGGVAKVTQENSYYGYGLLLPGSLVGWSAPPNKNLYNGGSEWQNDTKAINAGVPDYYQTFYRNYDPALERFVAVDPMAEGTESMSVFQYGGDNPINMNDPDGDKLAVKNNLPPPVNNTFLPYASGGGGDGGTMDPIGQIGYNSDSNWMNDGAFDDNGPFSSDHGAAGYQFWAPSEMSGGVLDVHHAQVAQNGDNGSQDSESDYGAVGGSAYESTGGSLFKATNGDYSDFKWDEFDDDRFNWANDVGRYFPSTANSIAWTQGGPYPPGAKGGPRPLYGNFVGAGPDGNPYYLIGYDNKRLMPINMLDAAAQRHDYYYWLYQTGGAHGALFEDDVYIADQALANAAWNVILMASEGINDTITGKPITSEEVTWAILIYDLFKPVSFLKSFGMNFLGR